MPPSTRKSGNPAKRTTRDYAAPTPATDPADKYAPNAWLNNGVGTMEDVLLPSGQLALVRRPGVEGLVKAGVLKNLDSLTSLVNEAHIKRVEGKNGPEDHVDLNSLMADEERMAAITHVIDRVLCYVVVRPEVHMTPGDATRRVPGVVYADMVDLVDKMFVFNYVVGGTRDLESFRNELSGVLGGLAVEPDVPEVAE